MKKTITLATGVILAGAVLFLGNNTNAKKDLIHVNNDVKANHEKTLESLGIKTDKDSIQNLKVFTDKKGKKWIYNSFVESELIEQKIKEKYSEKAASSFIECYC